MKERGKRRVVRLRREERRNMVKTIPLGWLVEERLVVMIRQLRLGVDRWNV